MVNTNSVFKLWAAQSFCATGSALKFLAIATTQGHKGYDSSLRLYALGYCPVLQNNLLTPQFKNDIGIICR